MSPYSSINAVLINRNATWSLGYLVFMMLSPYCDTITQSFSLLPYRVSCAGMLSHFCRFQLFVMLWMLLCLQASPGKNTRVSCHAFLQGIFLAQGTNSHLLHLLHCRQILYPLSNLGSPNRILFGTKKGNEIQNHAIIWINLEHIK